MLFGHPHIKTFSLATFAHGRWPLTSGLLSLSPSNPSLIVLHGNLLLYLLISFFHVQLYFRAIITNHYPSWRSYRDFKFLSFLFPSVRLYRWKRREPRLSLALWMMLLASESRNGYNQCFLFFLNWGEIHVT